MKCPKCVEAGLTSILYCEGVTTTNLGFYPYYDENGVFHSHDPNWKVHLYSCSRGHRTEIRKKKKCDNCDYGEI